MKLRLHEILNLHGALRQLPIGVLPAVVSMKLALNDRAIEPVFLSWQKTIKSKVSEHAEKDEAGRPKFTPTGEPVWTDPATAADIAALQDEEYDVALLQFPASLIPQDKPIDWPILRGLLPMFTDEIDPAPISTAPPIPSLKPPPSAEKRRPPRPIPRP
jgi:hypothetical protein